MLDPTFHPTFDQMFDPTKFTIEGNGVLPTHDQTFHPTFDQMLDEMLASNI